VIINQGETELLLSFSWSSRMKMKMRNFPVQEGSESSIYNSGGVVEISLQVGYCWLWSLIIFLIQRSLLSAVFIPHEVFTPQKYVHSSTQGSAEGGYPLAGSGGSIPPAGGSGGKTL
jgi:hypothetical protein